MCNKCNGSHVIHAFDSSKVGFYPCPICGPEPEDKFKARMAELKKRIETAKGNLIRKGA